MKKYIFRNPIKEALETQGKRWIVAFLTATAMLVIMAVVTLSVVDMPICGSVTAVAVALISIFFVCQFGVETEVEETEEE